MQQISRITFSAFALSIAPMQPAIIEYFGRRDNVAPG
jgi:hypothetical protein